ncbi:hypothetical protein D3C87_360490 [compost metagenome]
MRQGLLAVTLALLMSGCAAHQSLPTTDTVDTRTENVNLRRLQSDGGGGAGAVQPYQLQPSQGYRMPQLYAAPDPVLGDRDPRRELQPTMVCLQVVVDADGRVERSVTLLDRAECTAGGMPENAPLVEAAQAAVAQWRYSPAAVCHYRAGHVQGDRGDCSGAERVEPVPVSLLYAFTFEIVKGKQTVHRQGR